MPCGKFLEYCRNDTLELNCQTQTFFALGYMSALSWEIERSEFSSEVFHRDNIKYSLINYCKKNPLKDTHDGAIDVFYKELLPLKSK